MAAPKIQSPTFFAIAIVAVTLFVGQLQTGRVFLVNRWQRPIERDFTDASNPEAYWIAQCFIALVFALCGYLAFRRRE